MSKIKCLQCGQVLESKFRHDFQQCKCSNQTAVDGGNSYLKLCGVNLNLIGIFIEKDNQIVLQDINGEIIIESIDLGPQKQPSSVSKIEAEKKSILKRLEEIK